MCSILAIISRKKLPESLLDTASRVLEKTEYRGPDSSYSILCDDKMYLGSNRLAIIGLTAEGRMPLKAIGKKCWIVFNGEIYNYKELRLELEKEGLNFVSGTDTEVVINSYLRWGQDFVGKLNGMFAFVIYDKEENKVIAARDRFGTKPLFYTFFDNSIIFNSEFLPLKEFHNTNRLSINYAALTAYIKCRFVPGKSTIFTEINKIEPAEIQITNLCDLSQKSRKFYKPTFSPIHYNQDDFNQHLDRAIQYTAEADITPSLLLSGGLDSAAIAAILHKKGYQNIPNFTCTFKSSFKLKNYGEIFGQITNPNIDERDFAYEVSKNFGYNLTSFIIDSDLQKETFLDMQTTLGEPIASPNALGLFLFSKALKGKTKLAITGTGADELLGGYQNLYFKQDNFEFNSINPLELLNIFSDFDSTKYNPISFLKKDLVETNYIEQFTLDALSPITKEEFPNELLNQLMLFELALGLPGWELDQADRLFMKQSIELRPAFLENTFVDFCLSIPSKFKYSKRPLKLAMRGMLPTSIIERAKYPGLGTPQRTHSQPWFTRLLEDLFKEPLDIWDASQIFKLKDTVNDRLSFDVLYRLVYLQSWLKNIANFC